MMEAVRTSETSVYSNETIRRYIPEGFNLHVYIVRESYKIHENKTQSYWLLKRLEHIVTIRLEGVKQITTLVVKGIFVSFV
jgi:hypothetical protein